MLLAEILTDLDLPEDSPIAEQCGSCVRCLNACPTDAFVQPGLLDANRCIAYWTIEHRGPLPDTVKEELGQHVFGCDVCQEVCPYNKPLPSAFAKATADTAQSAEAPPGAKAELPTRLEWLEMGKGAWRKRFGATALNRAHRRGIQRNAAASAGSVHDSACLAALPAIASLPDRGASDAARWARGRLDVLPR